MPKRHYHFIKSTLKSATLCPKWTWLPFLILQQVRGIIINGQYTPQVSHFSCWVSFWTRCYCNSKSTVSTGNFILSLQNFQDWWIEDQGLRMENGGCRGDMEELRCGVHISKLHCLWYSRSEWKLSWNVCGLCPSTPSRT